MRIGLQVWGQFVEWDELMTAGRTIERLGFSSLWSNDHFYPAFGAADGPVLEGWITLAGWATQTERIPLGCMVSCVTYRNPALLVKMATTLDRASHGRLTLGIGAGWHEREHRAMGYELLPPGARIARLAEAATIVRGLLDDGAVTFRGKYFSAEDARNDPPPFGGRHIPLLIGGSGERRTLAVVARYADAWNGEGDPATIEHKLRVLRAHCRDVGRDPEMIRVTVELPTPSVRATGPDAIAALAATFERHGLERRAALDAAAASQFTGTVDHIVGQLLPYARAGVEEVIFNTPSPLDLETLTELAGTISERVAGPAA